MRLRALPATLAPERIDRRSVAFGLLLGCLTARAAAAAADLPIVAWGDSLTLGTGARDEASRYPARLGTLFAPPRPVRNAGVGGESSTEIAGRMLRDNESSDATAIIWAGRNNYDDPDQVFDDLRRMTDHVRHGRFLVLSILNADVRSEYRGQADYERIAALNDRFRAQYGDWYLDVRSHLVDRGLASARLAPTAGDEVDIGHDVPPRALRADHIHLNSAGQSVVAERVHLALAVRGW